MLTPLNQFICDKCRQIIRSPEEGWVEWESKLDGIKHQNWGFKIVHHFPASPLKDKIGGCYFYEKSINRSDMSLTEFSGQHTMPELLGFIDIGPYHDPNYNGPSITDLREFVEFARRLTIPFYEEARQYWQEAIGDGYFDTMNEILIYMPETLQRLISKYQK